MSLGQTNANQQAGASFSNFDNSSSIADNSNITATAQTAYAPILAGGADSTISYTGSDFGAMQAALAVFQRAEDIIYAQSADSQITARQALQQAQKTVGEQGAGALALITTPFLWVAGIAGVCVLAFFYFANKKKGA